MKYYFYKDKNNNKFVQLCYPINPDNNSGVIEFCVESSSFPTQEAIAQEYQKVIQKRSDELNAKAIEALRNRRNEALASSDWTQAPDSPLSPELKDKWKQYRQALRDLPNSKSLSWPVPPPTK